MPGEFNVDQMFFQYAGDLIKQTVTLDTFILGMTVTFWKETYTRIERWWRWFLPGSWLCFFGSIVSGIVAMMALTASVVNGRPRAPGAPAVVTSLPMSSNVEHLVMAMQILFGLGTLFVLVFGLALFWRDGARVTPPSAR